MNKRYVSILWIFTIVGVLFLALYAVISVVPKEVEWAIASVYQVPRCTEEVAKKYGINPSFPDVKEYIISAVEIGMTESIVEETLSQFGRVIIKDEHTLDNHDAIKEVLVVLCKNPFGNVLLNLKYDKDGILLRITDAVPQ